MSSIDEVTINAGVRVTLVHFFLAVIARVAGLAHALVRRAVVQALTGASVLARVLQAGARRVLAMATFESLGACALEGSVVIL